MGSYECFLVTVFYESHGTLLRCALKVDDGALPEGATVYPMEHKDWFHSKLPQNVRSCGPVVDVEPIFEVAVVE